MSEKRVYTFGNGKAEGRAEMRNLLGGKGANLAEMNLIGVPVPPGFTITTDVWPAPERVPYLRVLAATAAGRAHLRCLRDAGAPVLTKPADVPALGPAAEELFTLESRCTDLYVLARPDLTQAAPGQDYRTTPVIV